MNSRVKADFYPFLILFLLFLSVAILEFGSNDYAENQYRKFSVAALKNISISAAAKRQPKSGQILCWITTDKKYHTTRVPAIQKTWSKRCDATHFFTNVVDDLPPDLPYHTIFRKLPYFYLSLFWKTHLGLYYTYQNISKKFQWYVKADDDSYIIVENLRNYLSEFDSAKPYYLGFRLKLLSPKHGYNSGSVYVLSNKAVELFVKKLFDNAKLCRFHLWEDFGLARCFASLSIYPEDTRDKRGQQRFFAFRPEEHLNGRLNRDWIFDNITDASKNIFHENVISFHHLTPEEIILAETIYQQKAHSRKTTTSRLARASNQTAHAHKLIKTISTKRQAPRKPLADASATTTTRTE